MAKKRKAKAQNATVKKDYGYYLGILGSTLMWVILSAYFIVLPFFFKNGYEMIATNKYRCFMAISKISYIAIAVYIVIVLCTWGVKREELAIYKPLKRIDICMLVFILFAGISYMLSSYKRMGEVLYDSFYEGALYGASGWFMGLMTYLIVVGLYFSISRIFIYNQKFWIPVLVLDSIIFIWAFLNRYGIEPIKMAYANRMFLACVGQINWLAGFSSIIVPVVYGLYWAEEHVSKRRLYLILLFFANLEVLINGSDSSVMSFAFMSFALLIFSLKDEKKMLRFSESMLFFSLTGLFILVIDLIFPEAREFESVLANFFVKGFMPFVFFAVFFGLWLFFTLVKKGKATYKESAKKKLPVAILILGLALIALIIIIVAINTSLYTKNGFGLPIIGKNKYFIFNKKWGTSRGTTMRVGLMNFRGLSFREKLFGSGPDTFYFALLNNDEALKLVLKRFGDERLTNAHNELLTLLVNTGIFGVSAFISLCVVSMREFAKRVKEHPFMIIFVLSMVMYLANNLVSFEQIVNLPFFFIIIGIGASAIVRKAP